MTTTSPEPTAPREPGAREEGAQALEFALTLPLLLAVLWGLLSYGLVFTVDHTLSAAASEGARAAVGTRDEPDAVAAATAAATARLTALGANAGAAEVAAPVVEDCPAPAGTRCITVDVSYPWATAPIIPSLFDIITPDVISATATVQLSQ